MLKLFKNQQFVNIPILLITIKYAYTTVLSTRR